MSIYSWVKEHVNQATAQRLERDSVRQEQMAAARLSWANVPHQILIGLGFDPAQEPDVNEQVAWMERALDDGLDTVLMVHTTTAKEQTYAVAFGSTRWNRSETTGWIYHCNDEQKIANTYSRYAQAVEQAQIEWIQLEVFRLFDVLRDSESATEAYDSINAEWHTLMMQPFSEAVKDAAKRVWAEGLWRLARGVAWSTGFKTVFDCVSNLEDVDTVF